MAGGGARIVCWGATLLLVATFNFPIETSSSSQSVKFHPLATLDRDPPVGRALPIQRLRGGAADAADEGGGGAGWGLMGGDEPLRGGSPIPSPVAAGEEAAGGETGVDGQAGEGHEGFFQVYGPAGLERSVCFFVPIARSTVSS